MADIIPTSSTFVTPPPAGARKSEWLRANVANAPWSADHYTDGDYETEKEAEAHLDRLLDWAGCFRVYKQVRGQHLQPRLGQDHVLPIIDRLLLPLQPMVAAGWTYGAVGIECKRTFEKIGRPTSQMIDYGRSAFRLPESGVSVVPSHVFLWPYNPGGGPLASIYAQQHLGGVTYVNGRLLFITGQKAIATLGPGPGEYEVYDVKQGKKAGSR